MSKIYTNFSHVLSTTMYRVSFPIPFYSQQVDIERDLQGFRTAEDAEHWQSRGCGIASLRMILDAFRQRAGLESDAQYGDLLYQGLSIGAYGERGWIHQGLIDLAAHHHLIGQAVRNATVEDLARELRAGRPCIASVTVCFRGGEPNSGGQLQQPGGHLIVVIGYVALIEAPDRPIQFLVHHPSVNAVNNWSDRLIAVEAFSKSFASAYLAFSDFDTTLSRESRVD